MNDKTRHELKTQNAGDPDRIRNLAGVRERFHESRWATWNLMRDASSTTAFGCLGMALVVFGRSTAS